MSDYEATPDIDMTCANCYRIVKEHTTAEANECIDEIIVKKREKDNRTRALAQLAEWSRVS